MTTIAQKKMISAYFNRARPLMAMTSFFQAPPENYYNSKTVEIDVYREGEHVAIVCIDMATGAHINVDGDFQNKEFTPPVFNEGFTIDAFDLFDREPGQSPFEDVDTMTKLNAKLARKWRPIEDMIRRAIELQASQIMQTGVVTLIGADGVTRYTLDFRPKSSHLPTTGTAWSNVTTANGVADLQSLCNVVRDDGLIDPDQVWFGETAFNEFIRQDSTRGFIDLTVQGTARLVPMQVNPAGAQYRGTVEVGNYKLDMYTYGARYTHQQTGVKTQYLGLERAVVRASGARMDLTFGNIPRIAPVDPRLSSLMQSRMVNGDARIDLHPNVYLSPNGRVLHAELASRPLCIPTAIDSFACLST